VIDAPLEAESRIGDAGVDGPKVATGCGREVHLEVTVARAENDDRTFYFSGEASY
jgi:hypothetical protein